MLLRAPWPLVPRPAVLPPLPPMPRPTRRLARRDPGAGFKSWTFIDSAHLLDLDEMRNAGDHAPDLGTIGQRVRHPDAAQAKGPHGAAGLGLGPDGGLDLGDLEVGHRAHAT